MAKWKTLRKKIVYQNRFLKVSEDDVLDPNNNKAIRNVIEVGEGSVVVIAIGRNKELYLVGQPRYAVNQYSWEFVSGGIKQKEKPLAAAKRELFEELNLNAGKWQKILAFHPNNSLMNRTTYVFLAAELNQHSNLNQDSYEKISVRTITKQDLIKEIKNGKVQDGFTITAFFAYLFNKEKIK